MAVHDYRCWNCRGVWIDRFSLPGCTCSSPDVRITWEFTTTMGLGGPEFHPIVHDGITYQDKATWEGYKRQLATNLGVSTENINIVSDSPANRKVIAEEKFHRHNTQREKKGLKPKVFKV